MRAARERALETQASLYEFLLSPFPEGWDERVAAKRRLDELLRSTFSTAELAEKSAKVRMRYKGFADTKPATFEVILKRVWADCLARARAYEIMDRIREQAREHHVILLASAAEIQHRLSNRVAAA